MFKNLRQFTSILTKRNNYKPIIQLNSKFISNKIPVQTSKTQYNEIELSKNLPVVVKPSILTRIKEAFGYQGGYRYSQETMALAGIRLYLCIQKQIDFDRFFKLCEARDVFFSFCLVTYLHIWIVTVRLAQEGRSGDFVRNRLIEAMWGDISKRIKQLGNIKTKIKKQSFDELNEIFRASLFGFDEGILSNDCVLANAIWRHLLEKREIEDFTILTQLCEYMRKNVKHFDDINEIDLLSNGLITFVDLDRENADHMKEREKHIHYILSFK